MQHEGLNHGESGGGSKDGSSNNPQKDPSNREAKAPGGTRSEGQTQSIDKSRIQFGAIEAKIDHKQNRPDNLDQSTNKQGHQAPQGRGDLAQTAKVEIKLDIYCAQFCGSAALGQGFFFIEDTPYDQKVKDLYLL